MTVWMYSQWESEMNLILALPSGVDEPLHSIGLSIVSLIVDIEVACGL